MYSCQVRCMHVHVMVPGQRLRMAKSCKGETRVPDALIGTYQLRETTPTENPRSSKVAGLRVGPATRPRKNCIAKKSQRNECSGLINGYRPQNVLRNKTDNLYIETWNVMTLLKHGKLQELAEEVSKTQIEILAVREVRLPGKVQINKKDYLFYYSGTKEKIGQAGTGFLLMKKIQKYIINFELHNERLCKLSSMMTYSLRLIRFQRAT